MKSWDHALRPLSFEERRGALCSRCGKQAEFEAAYRYLRRGIPTLSSRKLCPQHKEEWVTRHLNQGVGA